MAETIDFDTDSVGALPARWIGGVTGRGTSGLNLVHPIFEAFWHDQTTLANFHLAWSPSSTRSGSGGWETHHQIAFFIDRGVVKLFRKNR